MPALNFKSVDETKALVDAIRTNEDVNLLERWWVEKSRRNFFAYRQFMRYGNFEYNWFVKELARELQSFYLDLRAGKRPVLIIQTPPQHGKSWSVNDFISWVMGKWPEIRVIFASFSSRLGIRANKAVSRNLKSHKFQMIFPDAYPLSYQGSLIENSEHIEMPNEFGYFRNTTVEGSVTGESLDLGVIDDPVKGRKEANSLVVSESIWDWFTDDFFSRASKKSGLLIVQTRWAVNDLAGRVKKKMPQAKVLNFKAIADKDEEYRSEGEALFPELKPLDFLLERKKIMLPAYFEALYQGEPTIQGGNLFKDEYWRWWKTLPQLLLKFIVADTAQKVKTINDYTSLQCWGLGVDKNIYLLDHLYAKFESPALRREAKIFYNKHNTPRLKLNDPVLRGMFIEDKSSGSGLIQELKAENLKIVAVQRNVDKVFRSADVIPEVEAGRVYLNTEVPHVGKITSQGRHFPNDEFDDAIDCTMSAVEVGIISNILYSTLQAAMEAD